MIMIMIVMIMIAGENVFNLARLALTGHQDKRAQGGHETSPPIQYPGESRGKTGSPAEVGQCDGAEKWTGKREKSWKHYTSTRMRTSTLKKL